MLSRRAFLRSVSAAVIARTESASAVGAHARLALSIPCPSRGLLGPGGRASAQVLRPQPSLSLRVLPLVRRPPLAPLEPVGPGPPARHRRDVGARARSVRLHATSSPRAARAVDRRIGRRRHQRQLVGSGQLRGPGDPEADGRDGRIRPQGDLSSRAVPRTGARSTTPRTCCISSGSTATSVTGTRCSC